LEDPINNYIATPLKDGTKISFKQLANHTSGLPRLPTNFGLSAMLNPGNPYERYTDEKLVEYMTKELSLAQPAGEKYAYSNLGAGMLGYVLCQLTASNYQMLIKEHVFSKYNMTRSTTIREEVKNHLVTGRSEAGKEVSNWDLAALVGAGGILSTTEDLSKFALAQFDVSNTELALTRTKTFGINENMDIGLGWHLIKSKTGSVWSWHNGGTGGYTSSMAIDTERKNGIVILSNVSAFSKDMKNIDNLCFDLMRTLEK
jgi:CubicO group peptidase (beta-lactamase class C family)